MLRKILPQQKAFFDGFNTLGQLLLQMSESMLEAFNNDKFDEQALDKIVDAKEQAKLMARNLFKEAHKTFITPFDRHDIHGLNNQIYDAVNTINLTAQRCMYYHVHDFPESMKQLALICRNAAKLVVDVLRMLEDIKNPTVLLELCSEIKENESAADHLLIVGIAELYDTQDDIKTILKLKEVYGLLESVTDRYQMIAYIAEGIILEYS
ncbi:MAG: DUF47 family protein [Pseudomonadota bacterium]|nr:DUF47 family protein [Pseudomonadota bacterium]